MNVELSDVILGFVFLLLGGGLTHYFSSRRSISWDAKRRKVIDPIGDRFPSDIKISFGDIEVENLAEWKVAFWNSGNRCIDCDQFLSDDQIEVLFDKAEIVGIGEIISSREIIEPHADHIDGRVKMNGIRLLDVGDWFACDVYTRENDVTEKSDLSRELISARAEIKSIPKGLRRSLPAFARSKFDRFSHFGAMIWFGLTGILSGMISYDFFSNRESSLIYSFIKEYVPFFEPISAMVVYFVALLALLTLLAATFLVISTPYLFFKGPPKKVTEAIYEDPVLSKIFRYVR